MAWMASLYLAAAAVTAAMPRVVVGHRGASGYLPEHTLPSAAFAYALGADYIEPDVVLTKDGVPVILHDIHLEATTDVEKLFPTRKRADGRWYAIDFKLDEIRQLSVHERFDPAKKQPAFANRFPAEVAIFKVPTLEEEILLVQGLNRSTGRKVGLYPELKSPAFHTKEGQDIAKVTLAMLAKYGYATRDADLYLQCFDPRTLKYVRHDLKSPLKLVQLIAENDWGEAPDVDYRPMLTEAGIKDIAGYADGIGPWLPHVLDAKAEGKPTDLVKWAHAAGLRVHPYTLRSDGLPDFVKSLDELHGLLFEQAQVDGAFTDFSDKTLIWLRDKRLH